MPPACASVATLCWLQESNTARLTHALRAAGFNGVGFVLSCQEPRPIQHLTFADDVQLALRAVEPWTRNHHDIQVALSPGRVDSIAACCITGESNRRDGAQTHDVEVVGRVQRPRILLHAARPVGDRRRAVSAVPSTRSMHVNAVDSSESTAYAAGGLVVWLEQPPIHAAQCRIRNRISTGNRRVSRSLQPFEYSQRSFRGDSVPIFWIV